MGLNWILAGAVGVLLLVLYIAYKLKRAGREIDRLLKTNEQLQAEKAVVQTQVTHFETRKHNEENSRNLDRTALIERMQQQGDLRD